MGKRFGGIWIDRTLATPRMGVAVVELAQRDIERLVHEAAALERPLILAVLYSWEELNAFFEQALKPTVVGDSAISIGVAPDDNRVQLELTRADPELESGSRHGCRRTRSESTSRREPGGPPTEG